MYNPDSENPDWLRTKFIELRDKLDVSEQNVNWLREELIALLKRISEADSNNKKIMVDLQHELSQIQARAKFEMRQLEEFKLELERLINL
jgi:hypothetical protein